MQTNLCTLQTKSHRLDYHDATRFLEPDDETTEFTETQSLTWALIDGTIDADGQQRLNILLTESRTSRHEFSNVMNFHVAMREVFRKRTDWRQHRLETGDQQRSERN